MSVDTYFCFCCLSTNNLRNLVGNPKHDYAKMIEVLCSVKPLTEDCDDGCICEECANNLLNAIKFRNKVFETLTILEGNGLISICKIDNDYVLIKKKSQEYFPDFEEKYDTKPEINYIIEVHSITKDTKTNTVYTNEITTDRQQGEKQNITDSKEPNLKQQKNKINIGNSVKKKKNPQAQKTENKDFNTKKVEYLVTKDLKCQHCGEVLPNIKIFHAHMNRHFPNHICESCGKGFVTEKRLKRHWLSHEKGPFKCDDCGAIFNNCNSFQSHRQRKHSSRLLYACPQCPARLATFTRRARHLVDVHGERRDRYACPLCDKRFLISGSLRTHLRQTHLKSGRFKCEVCGATFFTKAGVTNHVASHAEAKYTCKLCSKRFSRTHALQVHMRIHTGEKPFSCDKCGKKFTQKCTLLNHIKTHDKKKEKTSEEVRTVVIETSGNVIYAYT